MPKTGVATIDRHMPLSISIPCWLIMRLNEEAITRGTSTSRIITDILSTVFREKPVMLPMNRDTLSEDEKRQLEVIEREEAQSSDPLPIDADEEG